MKWVLILSVAAYLASLVFLVFAAAASSRPSKARQRGLEFGAYLLAIVLLTYFNVPSATVALLPVSEADAKNLLSAVKTLLSAVALFRVSVLLLSLYGQREALRKHIEEASKP